MSFTPDKQPFVWLPKDALSAIEHGLEMKYAGSAKLVLLACYRVANSEASATFTKPISYIATLASLERRTVERRLPDLVRLGLIKIESQHLPGSKGRDLNRYTLPTLRRNLATQSHNLATRQQPHQVAISIEQENREKEQAGGKPRKPMTVPERITLQGQIKIQQERLERLRGETSEQWQRDANPGLVAEKRQVQTKLTELENQLLRA